MGRAPCCDKANVKRGPWSPEEDAKLKGYIHSNGTGGNWIALPQKAGLKRCGKSCRLRWLNYLRPNIKHGEFSDEEDTIICTLYAAIGSRWSIIAGQLPGRTDNDIKNYWNTKLKKKLMKMSNNIINPNPPLMLSNQSSLKSPSPESSNNIPFLPSPTLIPNYYNAPSSLTGFDQTAGFLVNSPNAYNLCPSPPMQNNNHLMFVGAPELACTSQNSNSLSFGETTGLMGHGLEEIKQLISPNTVTSNGYFDEGNVGERVMMYYYDLMYVDLVNSKGGVNYRDG